MVKVNKHLDSSCLSHQGHFFFGQENSSIGIICDSKEYSVSFERKIILLVSSYLNICWIFVSILCKIKKQWTKALKTKNDIIKHNFFVSRGNLFNQCIIWFSILLFSNKMEALCFWISSLENTKANTQSKTA